MTGWILLFGASIVAQQKQLLVFEGSDWCVNCIQFEKKVLKNKRFQTFLQENNILLIRVDFPQRKKLNEAKAAENGRLAKKYGFAGIFPTVILSHGTETFQTINPSVLKDINSLQIEIQGYLKE